MSEIKYTNNRDIQQGNNFLTNFRPSGFIRIFKFPFEYSLFQTALTYGILYNGFGIHSYYLQKTGSTLNYAPWARMKTLGTTFGKYFALALPFYYLKEVFCSLTYIATRDKPRLRKTLDYAFLQNIFAFVASFPIFYFFQRNLLKSARGCVVLTVFSMINDIFIETKRRNLVTAGMNYEEIVNNRIQQNVEYIKEAMESKVKNDSTAKKRLSEISWENLRDDVLMNKKRVSDPQALRKEQLDNISAALREEFKYLHKLFD